MHRHGLAGKQRTAFFGVVAYGQHGIERLAGKLIYAFRAVAGNVDSELPHNGNRFGPYGSRPCPGTEYFEAVSCVVTQEAFGHLASSRVSGTENEDSFLIGHQPRSPLDD